MGIVTGLLGMNVPKQKPQPTLAQPLAKKAPAKKTSTAAKPRTTTKRK